jgi:hypothetical protein
VGSLTKCIAKMGKLLDPADVAALTAFDGSAADAVDARIAEIRAEMDEIRAMAQKVTGADSAPRELVRGAMRYGREGAQEGSTAMRDAALGGLPMFSRKDRPTDQTDTPAFKAWFGDSKVVDAEGKPLVVYHGTTADVESFDLSFSGSDGVGYSSPAIFATSDSALASDYALNKFDRVIADAFRALQKHKNENPSDYVSEAYEALYSNVKKSFAEVSEQGRRETGGGANVMPLYMSMQNPLVVDGEGKRFMQVMPDAIAKAVAGGHDGIIVNRVIDNASPASDYPAQIFIAFRPGQIKSATGNAGTFDPNNPSILKSVAPRPTDQTDTPDSRRNLREFLRDSKVRAIVYHGTSADFDAFDTARGDLGARAESNPPSATLAPSIRRTRASCSPAEIAPPSSRLR